MARITKSIQFTELKCKYIFEAYINQDDNVLIQSLEENNENWVVIKKEDWEDFKNFIDEQLKEL